ncbi:hypothetical protein QJB58_000763 [Listeria monocytogenes]|nr:hypothetical protein [Listeria monocytogenes]ELA3157161.1 hypothetical protein [Listeria monocytogenes]
MDDENDSFIEINIEVVPFKEEDLESILSSVSKENTKLIKEEYKKSGDYVKNPDDPDNELVSLQWCMGVAYAIEKIPYITTKDIIFSDGNITIFNYKCSDQDLNIFYISDDKSTRKLAGTVNGYLTVEFPIPGHELKKPPIYLRQMLIAPEGSGLGKKLFTEVMNYSKKHFNESEYLYGVLGRDKSKNELIYTSWGGYINSGQVYFYL